MPVTFTPGPHPTSRSSTPTPRVDGQSSAETPNGDGKGIDGHDANGREKKIHFRIASGTSTTSSPTTPSFSPSSARLPHTHATSSDHSVDDTTASPSHGHAHVHADGSRVWHTSHRHGANTLGGDPEDPERQPLITPRELSRNRVAYPCLIAVILVIIFGAVVGFGGWRLGKGAGGGRWPGGPH